MPRQPIIASTPSGSTRHLGHMTLVYKNAECKLLAIYEVQVNDEIRYLKDRTAFHTASKNINRQLFHDTSVTNREISIIKYFGDYTLINKEGTDIISGEWRTPKQNDVNQTVVLSLRELPQIGDTIE